MSGSSFGRQAIVIAVVVVVIMTLVTGSYLPLMMAVTIGLGAFTFMSLSGRLGTDRPHAALPVAPISDPANIEGRVDRMTVDEEEVPSTSWKPWEQTIIVPVYSITISGLPYRLDPAPARRGSYDWLSEGRWVTATFDRRTRVVYDVRPGIDPTSAAASA